MEDRELSRNARSFRGSGTGILLVGLAVAAVGGLIWLLGTATEDVVQGIGGMIAWVGLVIAAVGLVLLLVAAVTHRFARHRPFA